jgi:hypothetical protein
MEMTRKQFLQAAAGVAAVAAVGSPGVGASKGKPKRGVSLYSYSDDLGSTMTMEDCMVEMLDMGAEGIEILAPGHVDGYPNPSAEWIKNWFALLEKYRIKPGEYCHWMDSRLHPGRELDAKETVDYMILDMKLANRLGFRYGRSKFGVIDNTLTPVKNWREIVKMALPYAQKYDFRINPEVHLPTKLKSQMMDDYVDFIDKEKTLPWFGLHLDLGLFQNKPREAETGLGRPGETTSRKSPPFTVVNTPEEIVPFLPYAPNMHSKFFNMSEDFVETTIPYDEIIPILIKHKWDGYLLSEYEGPHKEIPGYTSDQLRKQHVMLKRLLGEA